MRAICNVFNVTRSHEPFSLTLCSKNARIRILIDDIIQNRPVSPEFLSSSYIPHCTQRNYCKKNVEQHAIVSLNIFIRKTELKCNDFLYKKCTHENDEVINMSFSL